MSHELESVEGWRAVIRDLCRWTSKERQDELTRNERRTAYEAHQFRCCDDPRTQWDAIRSASRRGMVNGIRSRKDFSWTSFEEEEREIEGDYLDDEALDEHIELLAEDVKRRSQNAGK